MHGEGVKVLKNPSKVYLVFYNLSCADFTDVTLVAVGNQQIRAHTSFSVPNALHKSKPYKQFYK